MATGYTHCIEEGVSFRDFVLGCARAFGACVSQRDNAQSSELKKDAVSDYHTTGLKEAAISLARFLNLSKKDRHEKYEKEKTKSVAENIESIARKQELCRKYADMIGQVRAWSAPTPDHQGLKTFMISQLNDSIGHDCNISYYEKMIIDKEREAFEEWEEDIIESFKQDIEYHSEHIKKETETVNSRNDWKDKLLESLE